MPDLSSAAFARTPGGADRLLAAVLGTVGPVDVHHAAFHEVDPNLEIHVETLDQPGEPDAYYRVSLRRRETYRERLTRLLREVYDDPNTSHAQDAETILRALGADPDRLAP